MTKRILIAVALAVTLSGCGTVKGIFGGGSKGLEVEDQDVYRTETKQLLKGLPDDLRGDRENARHGGGDLRGDDSSN